MNDRVSMARGQGKSARAPERIQITDRDVLRRMLETGGDCGASVWMQNTITGDWFCWDSCTEDPGHDGPHTVWSDRDQVIWATWGPAQPLSPFVDLTGAETRPSPWTPGEIAILRSVESSRADGEPGAGDPRGSQGEHDKRDSKARQHGRTPG